MPTRTLKLRPFTLERYFARHEFSAKFLLSSSDCESWTVDEILALEPGAAAEFGKFRLGYGESAGSPALRREITRIYTTIGVGDVLAHSGAEEPILLFMQAALEAGDEVVVQQPCYQSLHEIPRAIGCEVKAWTARDRDSWRWELADLEALLTARTKVVVVNNPHNPTGSLMSRATLTELVALCERRAITLMSDEVYRESEQDPSTRLPAVCDLSAAAVSIGVLSKTYGLPGLRIGWIATRNARLLERVAELRDYTTICNSGPSEFLATVALKHRERLAARNRELIKGNLTLLDAFFERHRKRFAWHRPIAGSISFPRLRAGSADPLCEAAVTQASVMLVPGSIFGDEYGANFRLGFGRRDLPEALGKWEAQL